MWKLTIEDDEGKQTALPLAHDEYGLGRDEANAIRLTDRNISRKHATLKKNGQGWFIRDLASYNGTFVNGVRVAGEQLVHSGDVVQLGDYRLELLDEAAQPGVGTDTAPSMAAAVPAHHRPDRLVVVVGPTPGTEYPLDREYFSIGRAEDATISINHSSVSRLHAELIALGGGRYEIIDKGSANGIRINGVELKRGILEAGDALELGDVRLRFVGAGKMFRAGADQSQQLRAVGTFESVAPSVRAPATPAHGARSGIGKYVAIGAIVGLIAIVTVIVAMRSSANPAPANPGGATAAGLGSTDNGAALLEEAKALAQKNDLAGAHKKLASISDTSPLRDDPAFKEIEAKWADSMFEKAAAATDATEKRTLLNLIATTPTVDAERRSKAANMLQEVEPPATPDPTAGPRPVYAPGTGAPPTAGTPATAKTTDPKPVADLPPSGPLDNESIRKNLGPRVWSGKASEGEIKALKAACSALGDRACRDRAAAMLKKKQEEGK